MAMDGLAELLSDYWTAYGGVLGGLDEVFGVMFGLRWQRIPKTIGKSIRQKVPRRFFDEFRVEDKQPWRPQNLYLS